MTEREGIRHTGPAIAEVGDQVAVLLDFDGPVCRLLQTAELPSIALALRARVERHGVPVPDTLPLRHDPLEVLRYAASTGIAALTHEIEQAMCAIELDAAAVAEPTPDVRQTLCDLRSAGIPVAILSNNSAACIERYLIQAQLRPFVGAVAGRVFGRPDLLKPHRNPVDRAAALLSVPVEMCVIVGDARTDILVANELGIRSIGFDPVGDLGLHRVGAQVVIRHMKELVNALSLKV